MAAPDAGSRVKNLELHHFAASGWVRPARLYLALLVVSCITSCTFLSDKQYVEQNSHYRGIRRVAVFLQRWPVYLQLSGQRDLGEDFIKKTTLFWGPWKPAGNLNPRALDIREIDDNLMGEILLEALRKKGFQPFLAEILPKETPVSVETVMAQYQTLDPGIDAFFFCFYAPTLFLSHSPTNLSSPANRAYSLHEVMNLLVPGSQGTIWAGPRAALAPKNSISHAFIYISMTLFKASDWRPLWQVAGSHAGGRSRPWIPQCPPGPTDENYWADAGIIQTLMVNNLKCRLRHVIPYAF